jgi:oxaloacetate decarboxylase alpha subunit
MATTALYEAILAGCDMIDTAISSLSLGTSHPPTETLVAMLSGSRYDVGLGLDLLNEIADHFRKTRKSYSAFESSFSGADTRILISQIPGGMLSNLENQLKQQNAIDRMNDVMNEIPRVRKELGYPPLVTPTSQIVGTQAVLNVLQGERYKTITAETKAILGGYYGRTPAPVDPEIQKKAIGDEEPIVCRPADLIPPEMEKLSKETEGKAQNIEDVLTYALFPKVALDFFDARKNGPAKPASSEAPSGPSTEKAALSQEPKGRSGIYKVKVDGVAYRVVVEEGEGSVIEIAPTTHTHAVTEGVVEQDSVTVVDAPLAGRVLRFLKGAGDKVAVAETVLVIEAMKMETEIKAAEAGVFERYFVSEGADFAQGQPLYSIRK